VGSDLQSCPEVQPGASGSGLCVVPTADQALPSLQRAECGCASGEGAEESTRLLAASRCQAAALEGLLSMGYQKTSEARQSGACFLPSFPRFSGSWRTLCREVFVPSSPSRGAACGWCQHLCSATAAMGSDSGTAWPETGGLQPLSGSEPQVHRPLTRGSLSTLLVALASV